MSRQRGAMYSKAYDFSLFKEYRLWFSVQDCVIHARGMLRDFRKA